MRRKLKRAVVVVLALALTGVIGAASGVIPIQASSGHWSITAWVLHFAMQRSVATHTVGVEVPRLDAPGLALRGAGHYETGCRPCHGSPGDRAPGFARAMTPEAPDLPPRIAEWKPEELFYIVKHGIKFTGMPAWPSQQRDDEVWGMVAFLQTLPALDAEGYRRLVHGEAASIPPGASRVPSAIAAGCGRCHGIDGLGRGEGAFPKLAGQSRAYLVGAMQAYARGERHSGTMQPLAAELTPSELEMLATHYGDLPSFAAREHEPRTADDASLAPAIARGREIATHGIPARRVPSCADCHGPGEGRRNPAYPVLIGQDADYLTLQLELFKEQRRGGSPYAHIMTRVAADLTPGQIRDVALYYASLPSPRRPAAE